MTQSLLRLDAVKHRTGLSRSTLYRLVKAGLFPRPIAIGGTRAKAWPSNEIDSWIARQIERGPRA
jgi:prophage regulatory protein